MADYLKRWLLAACFAALTAVAANGMTAALSASAQSPQPVGALVTFSASVSDTPATTLWYRFRVRKQGGQYRMIRDYSPVNTLDWTAARHEGDYDIEVSARDVDTGAESVVSAPFTFQSRVSGDQPVVSPTANSLVFLYSAPACPAAARMRVEFQFAGSSAQSTPFQACAPGLSMNFYLAGLRAGTGYTAHHVLDTGSAFATGPDVAFTTGDLPPGLYTTTIVVPSYAPSTNPILLGGPLAESPVANDLEGNVLWYGPTGMTFFTRAEAGGEFWGIVESPNGDASEQVVRKFDLTGMTLLETNAARVNEQLNALGKRPISGFHHDARTIAGGRVAVLAGVEQVLTDVQGPGPVDVLGDMIIVFDSELNVLWTWDTFDYLDVSRTAVLKEVCPGAGCPSYYLATTANDWTHGNAVQETPDGNLLYSARNQDWLIKIAYDGGNGSGQILWKMGIDGDFQINSTDPFPWFSHQHDANFLMSDPSRLMVFDNGNTRVAMYGGNSRGLVLQVDEQNRTVTPVLAADLAVYSMAVGSAQLLRDGTYHFHAGFVQEHGTIDSYSFGVDAANQLQYEAHQSVILYRAFRMADMYTPN